MAVQALILLLSTLGVDRAAIADDGTLPIIDGDLAEPCAWPSVVRLDSNDGEFVCSGTLVHPLIVVTAAHCLFGSPSAAVAGFGEGPDGFVTAEFEFCEANPEFDNGPNGFDFDNRDFAFCKLREPIENIPIIPIAYGCELDALVEGSSVADVGFGLDENDVDGIKRFKQSELFAFEPHGELRLSGGTCFGDSGGPTLLQLSDGSWRQVGIHSYLSNFECTGPGYSSSASQVVPFIEELTGIDVSPCHDVDGGWDPSWACQAIPMMPFMGGEGDYEEGCAPGPLSDFGQTCGDPLDAMADDEPPNVSFAAPDDGAQIEADGGLASVDIEVDADDPGGWGVASVELLIEPVGGNAMSAELRYAPYRWRVQLETGGYYLKALASDHAEHDSETEWIAVGIGVAAPPPRPEDPVDTDTDTDTDASSSGDASSSSGSSEGSSTVGESSGGDSTGPPAMNGDDDGCGCRVDASPPGWLTLLLLSMAVSGARRRAVLNA